MKLIKYKLILKQIKWNSILSKKIRVFKAKVKFEQELNKIKQKIANQFMIKGKKTTSEKLILQSLKELQKQSLKPVDKIVQLAFIQISPIFKLHKINTNKKQKKNRKKRFKEIPGFISNTQARTSLGIKFILKTLNSSTSLQFYKKFKKEIFLLAQGASNTINIKTELQKDIILKKNLLSHYRWR